MNKDNHNSKNPIIIGAFLGLALSVVLCFTQNIDFMIYFSGAPHYIDSWLFEREWLVSVITFIYFIGLFGLAGYLLSTNLKKSYFIMFCLVVLVIHFVLLKFAGDSIFGWMKS